jgi:hypothetical protein
MSHFLAIVLIDPSDGQVPEKAHRLMWPYFDPNMETVDAKCDGFVIGGRYDGDIWGKQQHCNLSPAEYKIRYGLDVVEVEDNIRMVSELRSGLLPYAVVTPDGQWHDCKGKQTSQWETEWSAFVAQFPNHVAVAIDCHC